MNNLNKNNVPPCIKAAGSSESLISTITLDDVLYELATRSRRNESFKKVVGPSADMFSRRKDIDMIIDSVMQVSKPERKISTNFLNQNPHMPSDKALQIATERMDELSLHSSIIEFRDSPRFRRRMTISSLPPIMPIRKESQNRLSLSSKPLKMPVRKSSVTNLRNTTFDLPHSATSAHEPLRLSFPKEMMLTERRRSKTVP